MQQPTEYNVLHCHTNLSDGLLSHKEVLEQCQKYNISTVAFTDHDITVPINVVSELQALKSPVRFISGIEISASTVKEVGGNVPVFHIIGLFVDPKNEELINFCLQAKKKRLERLQQIVANLNSVGFVVSEKEIIDLAPDGTIGRPQIVRALLLHEENIKIINETFEKLELAVQSNKSLETIYNEAKNRDLNGKVYPLFLKEDSFIRNVYVPYLEKTTMDDAVSLIRNADGIAILAHPTYYREMVNMDLIETFAREGRIDGIETVYAICDRGEMSETFGKDINMARAIVKKYNLVAGGGGDFHTLDDFKKMEHAETLAIMEETVDFMTQIRTRLPKLEQFLY